MARIFFFSGEGNSLAIARRLGRELDAEVSSIVAYLRNPYPVDDEVVGVVTPVYCTELPPVVASFLEKVDLKGDPYLFAVANMGGVAGDTLGQAGNILAKRGREFDAGFTVLLPDSSIVFASPEKLKRKMLDGFDAKLDEIAGTVRERMKNHKCLTRNPVWMAANKIGWLVLDSVLKVKDRKVDSAKCVGCGTCASVCPADCITMVDGLPRFGEGCLSCFGCAQWCPAGAVSLGRLTPNDRTRYHHPDITPEELAEANRK